MTSGYCTQVNERHADLVVAVRLFSCAILMEESSIVRIVEEKIRKLNVEPRVNQDSIATRDEARIHAGGRHDGRTSITLPRACIILRTGSADL